MSAVKRACAAVGFTLAAACLLYAAPVFSFESAYRDYFETYPISNISIVRYDDDGAETTRGTLHEGDLVDAYESIISWKMRRIPAWLADTDLSGTTVITLQNADCSLRIIVLNERTVAVELSKDGKKKTYRLTEPIDFDTINSYFDFLSN